MTLSNINLRQRMKEYRTHFHLTQQDFAMLIGWDQPIYSAMELGRRNIDLDKINLIAKIYGVEGWEFVRSETAIPQLKELPRQTRNLVVMRMKEGKDPRNTGIRLPTEIKAIMFSGKLPAEFASTDIYKLLSNDKKAQTNPYRISDALNRGSIKMLIVDLGKKRGKEKLYRLK